MNTLIVRWVLSSVTGHPSGTSLKMRQLFEFGRGRQGHLFHRCALPVFVFASIVATSAHGADTSIRGTATVVDGDQLVLQGYRVLLYGVDAPELEQECLLDGAAWPCGKDAAEALNGLLNGQEITCADQGDAPYAKVSGVCRVGDNDVNAWLVSEGWALAARHVTRRYAKQETAAKKAGRGLWRGDFVKPWDWRRGERLD